MWAEENSNAELKEREHEKFFISIPAPLIQINSSGDILRFNTQAEQLLKKVSESLTAINLVEITCQSYQAKLKAIINDTLEGNVDVNMKVEFQFYTLDNDILTLLLSFSCFDSLGTILVGLEDISEYEKNDEAYKRHFEEIQITRDDLEERTSELAYAYEKLRKSELELETLNKNKDRFFSIISHDLRSPFNSLLGLTSLILDDFDGFSREEIRDSMYNLHQVSESLYHLIEDLLDWSRIQFNKIDFQPEVINLNEVVSKVITILKSVAKDKNISLVNIVPKNCTTKADVHMITTIIRNLVNNAIKFTPKYGLVKVSAGFHLDDLIVSVEDTGVGMPTQVVENLFKVGKKVSKNGTEGESGTGLGLIICKEFVEKHGGKIWAESQLEKGSKFIFRIPVEPEEDQID